MGADRVSVFAAERQRRPLLMSGDRLAPGGAKSVLAKRCAGRKKRLDPSTTGMLADLADCHDGRVDRSG